jgi:hypothetical protein
MRLGLIQNAFPLSAFLIDGRFCITYMTHEIKSIAHNFSFIHLQYNAAEYERQCPLHKSVFSQKTLGVMQVRPQDVRVP